MKEKSNLSNRKFIGVDLHTDQFTCCALSEMGGILWRQTFKLTPEALQEFYNLVDENTLVSLEATSNSFKFKEVIEAYVGDVFIYDPHKLKLISMVGKKTDKVDAHKLAMYLKMQILSGEKMLNPVYVPSQEIQDLRGWFTTYKLVLKEKQSIRNRIYSLFVQNLYQIEKSQMFSMKGRKAIEKLNLSENLRSHLEYLYKQLDFLSVQVDDAKKKITLMGANHLDEIKILTSIKGISVFTSIACIADFAEISRFENAKNFTSYMRSAPSIESSNQMTRIGKTNKHGRKLSISLVIQSITHFKNANPKILHWNADKESSKSPGKRRMAICRMVFAEMYHMLIKKELHYHCESKNHEIKLNPYFSFLLKNGIVLNEA